MNEQILRKTFLLEIQINSNNLQEEVEMEDIFEDDPILDIDGCDSKNPLAVTEYVDDIYSYYRKMEVNFHHG